MTEILVRRELHHGRMVTCLVDRPRDIWDMFAGTMAARSDAEAIVEAEHRLTYGELGSRALAWAAALHDVGIGSGDRVACLLANQPDYLVVLLAIWRLQAIAVPINVRAGDDEVAQIVARSGASLAIVDQDQVDRMHRAARMPVWPLRPGRSPAHRGVDLPEHVAAEDDPALILFTSGTTGVAKGVVLSHFAVVHSCLHYRIAFGLGVDDRAILAVPASHVTGLVAILLTMVACGGATIVLRSFRAAAFVEAAAQERVTYALLVPAMYALCLRAAEFNAASFASWRIAAFGGAAMDPATLSAFIEQLPGLGFANVYGATETCSPSSIMPIGETPHRIESVGLPVICGDVRIMDADGREVPAGVAGEIWIAGPQLAMGYWQDEPATSREFIAGYWRSGDIGSKDDNGFLYLHDRLKDLINRGGFKIYSAELENVLMDLSPIVEAAVLPFPCPVLGERIHAVLVTADGATVSADEVRAHVRARLADYKVPDRITFYPGPLPRNANGKVVKLDLRRLFSQPRAASL